MIYLHQGDAAKEVPKLSRGFDLVVADPPKEMSHKDTVEILKLCRLKADREADLLLYGVTQPKLEKLVHESLWNYWSSVPIYCGKNLIGWVAMGHKLNTAFPYTPQALYVSPKGFDGHPTAKGREWFEYMIRPYGYRNVLDPFAGLGAVGDVCKDIGAHYTGIEKSGKYFRKLRARLTQ